MLPLACASSFVLGIVLVLLGVHQAEMVRDLRLDLAQFGLLGALLALGFGIGLVAAGPLLERGPRRALFVGACVLAAIGCSHVGAGMGHVALGAHLVMLGVGGGACVTLMNAAVLDEYGARAATALAFMHATATAGAALGPWLIAWAQGRLISGWAGTFRALAVLYVGLALVALLAPASRPTAVPAEQGSPVDTRWSRVQLVKLFALGAVGFAYVGVENGLTLFAVPWALSQGAAEGTGRTAISVFWLALMSGRLGLALRRPEPSSALLVTCGASGALAVCAAAWGTWSPVLALAFAGLGLGPVYPLLIALTGRHFPRAGTALGLVSGAGAAGGFALPWFAGALADALAVAHAIGALGLGASIIALAALVLASAVKSSKSSSAAVPVRANPAP